MADLYINIGITIALVGVIWKLLQQRIDRLEAEIDQMRQDNRDNIVRLFEAIDKIDASIQLLTVKIAEGYMPKSDCEKLRKECANHRQELRE